jgi:hypothetical protein
VRKVSAVLGAVFLVSAAAHAADGKPPLAPSQGSGQPLSSAIEATAKDFEDMDAESVRARLGEPRLLRREPPAQVWQYADKHCVILLYLYDPKDGKGPARVKYARGRMKPGFEGRADLCLSGPASDEAPNASALPPSSPVVIPGREDTGTPIYSPGDPPPPK